MTINIALLSDLHLERGGTGPRISRDADVLVLAGDIHSGTARHPNDPASPAISVAQGYQEALDIPVIIVMGNHECYGSSVALTEHCMRDAASNLKDIHFLEKDSITIGTDEDEPGIRFLGTCLWSNCALYADMPANGDTTLSQLQNNFGQREEMVHAYQDVIENAVNDFTHITPTYGRRDFTAKESERLFLEAKAWLDINLRNPTKMAPSAPSVVVTHFAPSPVCIAPKFMHSPISPYFVNYLDPLIRETKPALWLYGHTHHCVDTHVGETRIISNQKGYGHEPDALYQADKLYNIVPKVPSILHASAQAEAAIL